jgi:hypothetical protein
MVATVDVHDAATEAGTTESGTELGKIVVYVG